MMKGLTLAWVFVLMGLLAFGGGTAVLPEMHRMLVDQLHWLTDAQFRDVYSIGQIAPGPNMTMVLLIGHRIEGMAGVMIVGLAFFLPDCAITLLTGRLWRKFEHSPWRAAMQGGMEPVAIGLMMAGIYTLARISILDKVSIAIAIAAFGLLVWRRINLALLVVAGGTGYLVVLRLLAVAN